MKVSLFILRRPASPLKLMPGGGRVGRECRHGGTGADRSPRGASSDEQHERCCSRRVLARALRSASYIGADTPLRVLSFTYREMVRCFGDRDPTTRVLLERILAQEEEHADDMHDLLVTHEGRPMLDTR